MTHHPGDELTIRPTELVAGGEALARVDGFPIFAANVYPGDVAVVRLWRGTGFGVRDSGFGIRSSLIHNSPFNIQHSTFPSSFEMFNVEW